MKRKCTKEDKIEAVLTTVVKEVVSAQQQSDENFLELEEKRMRFEADKKEEHEFQLRFMSHLATLLLMLPQLVRTVPIDHFMATSSYP